MKIISVQQLQQALETGSLLLLDVRGADEREFANIEPSLHIPLHEIAQRIGELNPQQPIAVLCHHGMRSEMAARFLDKNGFAEVANVAGGIDAWSAQIDPSVPRY